MNKKRVTGCLFLWLCLLMPVCAQDFDFNTRCTAAYQAIQALRFKEGLALIKTERANNPDNLMTDYIEDFHNFLTVYTTDTRQSYEQYRKQRDIHLAKLAAGNPASQYYLYTQAQITLYWAALDARFGEHLQAALGIRRAYKMLEENTHRFPQFDANKVPLGLLYALVGSIPDKYRWAVQLMGMDGDLHRGMELLRSAAFQADTSAPARREALMIYALLLINLQNDAETAWHTLRKNGFPIKNHLLSTYLVAFAGIYGKHSAEALEIIKQRPHGAEYAQFPLLDYLHGLALLHQLDTSAAEMFKKFLKTYTGDAHVKSAYQKLAWCCLLRNDTTCYKNTIRQALQYGSQTLDADRQAHYEASAGTIPHPVLLRARLLSDGASFKRALEELQQLNDAHLSSAEQRTEYHYRLGRIYQETRENSLALSAYAKAMEHGDKLPRYFAARSAYETGRIYEQAGNTDSAAAYYRKCLTYQEHEYKNGLDQKAKSALERIKK
ncbi:MAG: hypothetical protein NZM35_11860 [Chitinophagales bacterium]|nr:hypothetical protein [Chitinophagales bacterium]MDW8419390.1 hypothetical protein [Chitinophagales bacterium]